MSDTGRFLMPLLAFFASLPATAQDSRAYAQMATAAWSAFECSSLATASGRSKEQERLFLFGYDQGKKFISALQAKKIDQHDLSAEVPMMMLLLLEGPSPDFMLGRVFESAQDNALKDVYKTGDHFNSENDRKNIAIRKFRKLNCELIGNVVSNTNDHLGQ